MLKKVEISTDTALSRGATLGSVQSSGCWSVAVDSAALAALVQCSSLRRGGETLGSTLDTCSSSIPCCFLNYFHYFPRRALPNSQEDEATLEQARGKTWPLSFGRETSAHWCWPQKPARVRTLKMGLSFSWLSVGRETRAHGVDPEGPYTRDQAERLVSMASPWKTGDYFSSHCI